jgi:hypothetical protein
MSAQANRRGWWIVALVLAVAVALATVVVNAASGTSAAAAVTLEPAAAPGTDPFTASVAIAPATGLPDNVQASVRATRKTFLVDASTHLLVAPGTAPGLYGGSGDKHVCDPQRLVAYLETNPDKGAAWAAVLGISTTQIASYVAALTPVVLTNDTLVTNHGYRDGHATTLQSVLEAGTAVMVDATGTPRVKCNCGNPLTPAPARTVSRTRGERWPGYDPTQVAVVQPGAAASSLTLVNIVTGDNYPQRTGGGSLSTSTTTAPVVPAGPAATKACGWFSEIDNAPGTFYGPVPRTVSLPAGVTVPKGAAVYAASSDAFFIAPAGYTCTATTSEDDARVMTIVKPTSKNRFVTFNDGGSVQNFSAGCSYFPEQRAAFEQSHYPGEECPAPPARVRTAEIPTGSSQLLAAVVEVPAGVVADSIGSEPRNGYGIKHPAATAPTLALFIAHWFLGPTPTASSAGSVQCTLEPSQAELCRSNLRLALAHSKIEDQVVARAALEKFLTA